jgi:hypothetical protein
MGKKARLTCLACGASFKQKTETGSDNAGSGKRFCNVTCAAAGPSSDDYGDYGDIPPAFAGAAVGRANGGGGGRANGGGGYGSERGGAPVQAEYSSP